MDTTKCSTHSNFLLRRIGKKQIQYALDSSDPWHALEEHARKFHIDLLPDKLLVSLESLVLPTLQDSVQNLQIPPQMWLDPANNFIPILDIKQVAHNAEGIALSDFKSAQTLLHGSDVLSKEALALLIPCVEGKTLDTKRPHDRHKVALHFVTADQILVLDCWLVQLGAIEVQRQSKQVSLPQPIPTKTLLVIFHKTLSDTWDDFLKNPVRSFLDMYPHVKASLVSVLDKRVSRSKDDVRLTILVKSECLIETLKQSGDKCFIVPVDESGSPDDVFRPIWLGDVTLEVARQRASLDTRTLGIVTTSKMVGGTRRHFYGVRVRESDLRELRPKLTLDSQSSEYIPARFRYYAHPISISLDKDTVASLFSLLGWRCRPLVPKPGTSDTWIIGSDVQPHKLLFTMDNSDIVLTPVTQTSHRATSQQARKPVRTLPPHLLEHKSFSSQHRTFDIATPTSNGSSGPAIEMLEQKLDQFIRKQEASNDNVQRSVQDLRVHVQSDISNIHSQMQTFEKRTLVLESSYSDIRGLLELSLIQI